MLRTRTVAWLLAMLVVAGMALAQRVGGTVTTVIDTDPDSLDPQKSATAVVNQIMRYIGDTLVTKDLNGRYTAGLAEKWTPAKDGLSWTFTLREGIRFHNGSVVNAAAVRASFLRAKDPKTQSNVAAALLAPVKDVVVKDARTVEFVLSEPYALLIENLTQQALSIVDAKAANTLGAAFNRQPVLTGPWKVGDWSTGSQITLERNVYYKWAPAYARQAQPYISKLVFRIIPDAATATSAFLAGDVDILSVPSNDIERLKAAEKYQMFGFLRKGLGLFMAYNVNNEPFNDLRVRQAMAYLVNKAPLVTISLKGFGQMACGPLPSSIVGYWDGMCDYAPKFNVDRGMELLDQAGYKKVGNALVKDGKALKFGLMVSNLYGWSQSAQVIQAQLKTLGIEVEVEQMELNSELSKARAGEHQALLMAYTYTSADILNSYLNSRNIGTGYNWSHYKDQSIDDMLAQSRATSDDDERAGLYQKLQQAVIDKALWLPLWVNENYFAVQSRVKGVKLSREGFLALFDAYVVQ